nr:Phospholipase D [Escherichia coli]
MSGKKTIVTLLRVSLLACPLLFTTPSFAMIDTPSVKVGFSPEGSASALVLDTINSAESSIRNKGNTNRASQEAMKYINLLDIPLRTVDAFPIHHDKVIIVDGNTVETGSYNFSRAAARKNSENVVVLKNMPDVAAQYLEHWQDAGIRVQTGDPDKHFSPDFLSPQPPPASGGGFFPSFFRRSTHAVCIPLPHLACRACR